MKKNILAKTAALLMAASLTMIFLFCITTKALLSVSR